MTLPAAVADPELVARVLDEAEVATRRAPSWPWVEQAGRFLEDLWRRLLEAVGGAIGDGSALAGVGQLVALAALAAAAALVVVAVVRWRRRRRASRGFAAGPAGVLPAAGAPAGPQLDAAGWRAEVERRLSAGDVAAAVAALGWWLARALHGDRARPSWTGRETVARAGRSDLAPLVTQLDGFAYGPVRPAAPEVRGLAARFAQRLGGSIQSTEEPAG